VKTEWEGGKQEEKKEGEKKPGKGKEKEERREGGGKSGKGKQPASPKGLDEGTFKPSRGLSGPLQLSGSEEEAYVRAFFSPCLLLLFPLPSSLSRFPLLSSLFPLPSSSSHLLTTPQKLFSEDGKMLGLDSIEIGLLPLNLKKSQAESGKEIPHKDKT
jgi:hypothetical protein